MKKSMDTMERTKMSTKIWTILGLSLPVLVFATLGASQEAMAEHPKKKVRVELREWSVSPNRTTVKAGWIKFKVWNTGSRYHEFVIIKTDEDSVNLPRNREPNEEEDMESIRVPENAVDLIDEIEAFAPGHHKMKRVLLEPGHYALICNLPDHYMMGMHTNFEVVD